MNTKIIISSILLTLSLTFIACGGGGDNNGFVQRDRMGLAAVNTALIDKANKDNFNSGDPSTDVDEFRAIHIHEAEKVRAAVAAVPGFPPEDSPGVSVEDVVDLLVSPDVVRVDLSKPIQFPNGRTLTDDVIDPTLGLVLNRGNVLGGGPGVSDGISDDSTPLSTFPYQGTPNP